MVTTLNTTCWQGAIVSCHTTPPFFEIDQQFLLISQLRFHLHLIETEQNKIKELLSYWLKSPVEEMLYASSGVVPVVLVVVCFVGSPRFFGVMAWFALLFGALLLFRDSRFFGPATGRSDIVVEGGACCLLGPDLGMFRPANAGCFFGKSVLIPCTAQ